MFYMGMTAVCTVAGIGALMAALYSMDGIVAFDIVDIPSFGRSQRGFEEAEIHFDIDCDLSKLMHVNTRMFYAYIMAEWGNTTKDKHSSILWNYLIKKESPHFIAKDLPGNFTLRTVGQTIRGKTINYSFCIQQVPFVGFLRTKTLATKQHTLPLGHRIKE
jgi:hypothetical protein